MKIFFWGDFMLYSEVEAILKEVGEVPYPSIPYVDKNTGYAQMLYEDFAGNMGELSAICQYIFEHLSLLDEEIAKIMLAVSKVEMHHLDLIGELIRRLGKKPIFMSEMGCLWNAGWVKYNFKTIHEMMLFNIETEKIAIQGYEKAKKYTRNRSIIHLLDRIILDEQSHIKIFSKIAEVY